MGEEEAPRGYEFWIRKSKNCYLDIPQDAAVDEVNTRRTGQKRNTESTECADGRGEKRKEKR